MQKFNLIYLLLFVLCIMVTACSSGDDEVVPQAIKSSSKAITSFKFSHLNPEIVGAVSEPRKEIVFTVPNGTDVTALVPSITISDKATVLPLSEVAQDFTNPVKYTVTAEDGSKQEYTVTVIVSSEVSFTLDGPALTELQQDGVLMIRGSKFGSYANNKVVLKNISTGKTFEYTAAQASSDELLLFKVASDLPLGEYSITVYIGKQSKEATQTITVVLHRPEISSVDKTTVAPGNTITITGAYFAASGNKVEFSKGGFVFTLTVVSESTTSIQAKLPDNISEGQHTLSVTSNDIETFYTSQKITVKIPESPDKPVITSIDKSSYKKGETITITGKNLKKVGYASNINFTPFTSGVTQVRSAKSNEFGTQLTFTIPNDFSTGDYIITVEVNFEFSDEYKDAIEITN